MLLPYEQSVFKHAVLLLALDHAVPYVDLMGVLWSSTENLQLYCQRLLLKLPEAGFSMPKDCYDINSSTGLIYHWSMEIISERSIWGALYWREHSATEFLSSELGQELSFLVLDELKRAFRAVDDNTRLEPLREWPRLSASDYVRLIQSGHKLPEDEAAGAMSSAIETACYVAEIKKSLLALLESLSPHQRITVSLTLKKFATGKV